MKLPKFHFICCESGIEIANLQLINRPCPYEFRNKMYNELKTNYLYHELIYSVVNEQESFDNIWWGIQTLDTSDPDAQSASVRLFILKKLHAVLPHLNITIGKSMDGIPVLLNEKKEMNIPVSITHDHNYAGYSFVLGESFCGNFDIPIVTFED